MKNPAHAITTTATDDRHALADRVRRPPVAPSEVVAGPLQLEGGKPQTVLITVIDKTVLFSVPGSIEGHKDIAWETGGYALMIRFEFVSPTIMELVPVTPSLWFSDTYNVGSQTGQDCCVMSVCGTYHFEVTCDLPGGGVPIKLDPKIVVTPINNPGRHGGQRHTP